MWIVLGELLFIAVIGLSMWLIFGGTFGSGGTSEEDPPGSDPIDDGPDEPPIPTEGPGGRDALENYINPTEAISDDLLVLEDDEKEDFPTPAPAQK